LPILLVGTDLAGKMVQSVAAPSRRGFVAPADLLMVSLKPFELLDHHSTGGECVRVLLWKGTRHKNLGEARIRSRRLTRISSGNGDEVMDHFSCALDALFWDATTMSIA
jgi:hypothetical protein